MKNEFSKMKSLFGYMGGKTKIAPKIVELIPPHKVYVEPFFGSGAVMLQKGYPQVSDSGEYREVVNDIDHNLVNVYKVLREEPKKLKRYLDYMEYSEEMYSQCKTKQIEKIDDEVKRAAYYLFNLFNSFGSGVDNGFAYGKSSQNNVIIKRFDSKDTFFYFDPPYQNTTKYKHQGDFDYEELLNTLKNIKGQWILSHYRDDFVNKLEALGYRVLPLDHAPSLARSNGEKRHISDKFKETGECIVLNVENNSNTLF